MRLTSSAFQDNETVPVTYTCEGANVSPPLEFHEVPSDAQSLILWVEDPDAPAQPWVHWLVINIPPTTTLVPENSVPPGGAEALANGGTPGYEGPCPPLGEHRYVFKLFALDTRLDLDPSKVNRTDVIAGMTGHIVDEAVLTGRYVLRDPANAPT